MAGAALALAVLGGCSDGGGFRPLYGPTASGVGLQEKLAAVEIAPIPSRTGQRIRNELVFQHTGGGLPAPREYRLEITIRESLGSSLVRPSGEAASQIYSLDANFRLIRLSDKQVILQGASFGRAEFERFQPIYSNVRAREDAEYRAARQVADDLKTRLAAFLAREKA
jgi:LPS-assembly lipoprotein